MKRISLIFIAIIVLCSCSFKKDADADNTGNIVIDGKVFSRTSFVTVIPENKKAVIPGENTPCIDDVFTELRTVTLTGYEMCQYEVTQELYKEVIGDVSARDKDSLYGEESQELRPAAGINWYEAVIFCNKLSSICGLEQVYTIKNIKKKNSGKENEYVSSAEITWDFSKKGYRLPTEAEWEYASRAAGVSETDWKYKFSGSDVSKKVAWTDINSSGYSDDDETLRTHEVGLKTPNSIGLYDMSGNVAEWCMDWYRSVTEDDDFNHGNRVRDTGAVTNPCLKKGKYDNHVIRGGSYNQSKGMALNWQRCSTASYAGYGFDKSTYQGFRLARTL